MLSPEVRVGVSCARRKYYALRVPSIGPLVLEVFGSAIGSSVMKRSVPAERDGETYFYDINSLSNFVTDAVNLVGYDPFVRQGDLVEWRRAAVRGLADVLRSG